MPPERTRNKAWRDHAADWTHGRVDYFADFAAKQKSLCAFLVCRHPLWRYLPCVSILRASHCHAADWTHGPPLWACPPRFVVSRCGLGPWPGRFHFVSGHKQPGTCRSWFAPFAPLQAPLWACPPRFALSRCGGFTTRGFPSTRTNPGPTGWVLSICPRSGPSALFRTPPRFGLGRVWIELVAGIISHPVLFVHPSLFLLCRSKNTCKISLDVV